MTPYLFTSEEDGNGGVRIRDKVGRKKKWGDKGDIKRAE